MVPAPWSGSEAYRSIAAAGSGTELQLVFGEDIDSDTWGLLGQAGGIPGGIAASPYAAVAVGWLLHAGSDGRFSDAEIDMLGSTIAHELGHYAGLAHPVQFDDHGDIVGHDGLEDTPDCGSWDACEADLSDNLMFPYSSCDGSGCSHALTDSQASVLNRYSGTF